ncbi:PucR family transcriptional regulator [Nocardia terpenica]|uniref:PucR family transcriptional regulator n=1 Tax=Nocardia terpenica TaxID=455432 RepID=UPI00142E2295|nr:PucR family transcriptional regulator [Nocardia terpenica]
MLTEMPSDMVALLAEVIFTYADAIEAAVAVGYSEAELYPGSEVQIQRSQLLRALVGESASSPEDICSLSRSAQWRLPRTVCAIVLSNRELTVRRTPKLPPDVLADLDRPDPCLLMPDPGGPKRLDRMARALDGWTAVLGPTVALPEAANSMRWARTILTAESYGIVAGDGLVRCSDHWATLMLVQDIDLARTVVKERLAPLLELRDDMRNKLVETLLVWLQAGQNACTAATQLCVHSQTVRYRLRQLDDLLGPQLQDPNAQKELIIALSAYQLLENMNNQGMQRDGETEPRTTTSLSPQRNAC